MTKKVIAQRRVGRKVVIDAEYVLMRRRTLKMNQTRFWAQFDVTQSGGSRYESGRTIPKPIQKLIRIMYELELPEEILERLKAA